MDKNRSWRYLRLAGTAFSIALLALLLGRQDWSALLDSARSVPPANLVIAVALLVVRHFAFAWRWSLLLRAQEIHLKYRAIVKLQFAGLFATNFLPTSVGGDVARLAGVLPQAPDRVAGAASLVVDRLLGAFGMLFVLPFSWPLIAGYFGFGAPLSILAAGPALNMAKRSWFQLWSALRLWVKKPRSLLMALGASWLGILCFLVAIWVLARGLNMPVGFAQVAGATGLTYFISLFPFTINSYGLRELSVVFFYTELGSTPEQSAALALLSRLILVTISLPGALSLGGVLRRALPEKREQ